MSYPLEDDARSDWLDIVKAHVQRIRSTVGAIPLFALVKQIQDIRQGKSDSYISVPLLNLPLMLASFSRLSGPLNVLLLLWLYWQVRQMDFALTRYCSCAPNGRARLGVALAGLPGRGRWCIPVGLALALWLSAPILLGTCLLHMPLWTGQNRLDHPLGLSDAFPAVVFLSSYALVRSVQSIKSRALNFQSAAIEEPSAAIVEDW